MKNYSTSKTGFNIIIVTIFSVATVSFLSSNRNDTTTHEIERKLRDEVKLLEKHESLKDTFRERLMEDAFADDILKEEGKDMANEEEDNVLQVDDLSLAEYADKLEQLPVTDDLTYEGLNEEEGHDEGASENQDMKSLEEEEDFKFVNEEDTDEEIAPVSESSDNTEDNLTDDAALEKAFGEEDFDLSQRAPVSESSDNDDISLKDEGIVEEEQVSKDPPKDEIQAVAGLEKIFGKEDFDLSQRAPVSESSDNDDISLIEEGLDEEEGYEIEVPDNDDEEEIGVELEEFLEGEDNFDFPLDKTVEEEKDNTEEELSSMNEENMDEETSENPDDTDTDLSNEGIVEEEGYEVDAPEDQEMNENEAVVGLEEFLEEEEDSKSVNQENMDGKDADLITEEKLPVTDDLTDGQFPEEEEQDSVSANEEQLGQKISGSSDNTQDTLTDDVNQFVGEEGFIPSEPSPVNEENTDQAIVSMSESIDEAATNLTDEEYEDEEIYETGRPENYDEEETAEGLEKYLGEQDFDFADEEESI